ncbi:MAG: sulfatase-like hydrolase/transferase [Planctomycetes bacterium]|nr:sulfatase-like hydrolase/transferase [Planctomycetota bacterium]
MNLRLRGVSFCLPMAALVLGLTACAKSTALEASRPNLLLITLDTTRADRLGCYGYAAAKTPVLDALAARGVVFEQAYTPAPMTLPAHATLMTGLLPPQHGARVNGMHRLAADVPTLAERLSKEGYRTGAFVAAFVLDEKFGLARGFERYDDDLSQAYKQEVPDGLSTHRPGNLVVDAALAWLGERDGKDGTRPFFTWVHLYDAHFPWYPHGPDVKDSNAETGSYDGEVSFADAQVGRLLDFLREHGLEQQTIVVALADHGEGLGDHHETEHAYLLNEEVLHVPWIVAGPGVKAGHRVPALVSLEDFQPTALELLGLASTRGQGRSLVHALRGEPITSGESYAETDLPWTAYRWAPQRSLTTERWKYIRTPQVELYDRTSDRGEYANLAVAKKDVLAELDGRLRSLEAKLGERESDVAEVSSEEQDQLAALGYAAGAEADIPEDKTGLADVKQRLAVKDLSTRLRTGVAKGTIEAREQLEIAQRLVSESPETPSFHNDLGEAFVKLGDFEHALPVLAHVVELVPTDAGAHYALGDALQQMGRNDEARPHLALALELEPEMAAAHVGMGNVQRAENRPDLAAGEYSEALRLKPGYAEAYFNLALTFLDRGMPEKALENFELALEHKSGWALAHVKLANLLFASGRAEEAVPHFEAALAQFPRDADLQDEFGLALQELGRPDEARGHYMAAAELAPKSFQPLVHLGNLAFAYGKDELALQRYEEALRLEPGQAEPTARLARFLASTPDEKLRNGERALALAQRASDLTGGENPHALDTLAAAYAAAGRFPDAVTAAHHAEKRARAIGDEALAAAIEQRLALYALEKPFIAPRAEVKGSEVGSEKAQLSGK